MNAGVPTDRGHAVEPDHSQIVMLLIPHQISDYSIFCQIETEELVHQVCLPRNGYYIQLQRGTEISTLKDEGRKAWETCREALSAFGISIEEGEKMLGKAFGLVHSPYWGENRKTEVPKFEIVF
ncbi:hypothetical protein FF1_002739 [Malus domestica]